MTAENAVTIGYIIFVCSIVGMAFAFQFKHIWRMEQKKAELDRDLQIIKRRKQIQKQRRR